MCYSEELKREAGGFMVGDQWVLTGWKGMFVEGAKVQQYDVRHETPNFRFVMSPSTGFRWEKLEIEHTVTYTKSERLVIERGKTPRFYSMYTNTYSYTFGKVLTDTHGFHLAATKDGAKQALGSYGGDSDRHVFTKILALESAIEDNHAHVVMVIAPGEEPTEAQIQEIGRAKYEKYVGKSGSMLVNKAVFTPGAVQFATSTSYGWVLPSGPGGSAMIYGQAPVLTTASGIWVGADELEDDES